MFELKALALVAIFGVPGHGEIEPSAKMPQFFADKAACERASEDFEASAEELAESMAKNRNSPVTVVLTFRECVPVEPDPSY